MIERLSGACVMKQVGAAIIDVQGVGYGVEMTEAALAAMDEGREVAVWVHTHVREDQIRLFAFHTYGERQLFNLLLSVSGVGPKVAMAIIAAVPLPQLIQAIEQDDAAILEEVPGIGPRQSKKILLELKPKVDKLAGFNLAARLESAPTPAGKAGRAGGMSSLFESEQRPLSKALLADLKSALENFGYKDKELLMLLKRLEREPPARDLPTLIRLALAELAGSLAGGGSSTGPKGIEELF